MSGWLVVAILWLLGLATVWVGFLMWFRWRVYCDRRAMRTTLLGTFATDREGLSEWEEAFREEVARRRARREDRFGQRR